MLVAFPEQVDESTVPQVRARLLAAMKLRPRVLIADLSDTRWCDWAGAGVLGAIYARAVAAGMEFRLVLTDDTVRRVVTINGLDRLIPIYGDVLAARQP